MTWAVLGIAVLAARVEGGNPLLSIVAATITEDASPRQRRRRRNLLRTRSRRNGPGLI
jgi:hypothetical protein